MDKTERLAAHTDIAIIGGGPVGALLALKLARSGRQVTLYEARAEDDIGDDPRALALSWAGVQAFVDAGVSPVDLQINVIDQVHVSQQGGWGRTMLSGQDVRLPHLGAVVDYRGLQAAMRQALQHSGLSVVWRSRIEAVDGVSAFARIHGRRDGQAFMQTCRLAVLAEGGALIDGIPGISRRVHDYRQSALLAEVTFATPVAHIAYERFARRGPLALLPHGGHFRLVWSLPHAEAEALSADPQQLCAALDEACASRLGRVLSVEKPVLFPLTLKQASRVYSGRIVLIGNAAQTMHPVAAQGLNLGVRDALDLAAVLTEPGELGEVPRRYAALRRRDVRTVLGFTHGLVTLFERPSLAPLRGLGMNLLDLAPFARRRFTEHLVFGAGVRHG